MNIWIQRAAQLVLRNRVKRLMRWLHNPAEVQHRVFQQLIQKISSTQFGQQFGLHAHTTLAQYQERVPVMAYEEYYPWIEQVLNGKKDVLYPGKVTWFAKSSGTTNDRSKFIPITKDSLHNCHYAGGQDLLAMYFENRTDSRLFTGKTLSIGGSHEISHFNEHARYGDVSAVLIQNLPRFYELQRAPSRKVALLAEWEAKLNAIAHECRHQRITGMAGVPTWTLVLLKQMIAEGKHQNVLEIWQHLEVFFHGAVSFTPYREQFKQLIPTEKMWYVETYNASEGFIAFQNEMQYSDLLLALNHGIFYEFIPLDQLNTPFPKALTAAEVQTGKTYALVISTNGGLWRYLIGDTVKVTSTAPLKIMITGRTRHFMNAFGEEVMVQNAESAIAIACQATAAIVREFTAAPIYFTNSGGNHAGHEWLIEFEVLPRDLDAFTYTLDSELKRINSDYEAKRHKNIALQMPIVRVMPEGTFWAWMKQRGKLGGQNKVPRLSNDRTYVESILALLQQEPQHKSPQ